MPTQSNTLCRIQQVTERTQLSRATVYRLIPLGLFPHPVKIGLRAVAWRASDIDAFCQHGTAGV